MALAKTSLWWMSPRWGCGAATVPVRAWQAAALQGSRAWRVACPACKCSRLVPHSGAGARAAGGRLVRHCQLTCAWCIACKCLKLALRPTLPFVHVIPLVVVGGDPVPAARAAARGPRRAAAAGRLPRSWLPQCSPVSRRRPAARRWPSPGLRPAAAPHRRRPLSCHAAPAQVCSRGGAAGWGQLRALRRWPPAIPHPRLLRHTLACTVCCAYAGTCTAALPLHCPL